MRADSRGSGQTLGVTESFFALLSERFGHAKDSPFLRVFDAETLNYSQIDARSASAAGLLGAAGVRAGDRVVARLPKSADAIALYLGVLRLGAVYVPLNPASTQAEFDWFVADCEPAFVASHAEGLEVELDAAEPCHSVVERQSEDLAALVYTSGTTGQPKAAMLTHGNLASNALALKEAWAFEASDVLLHALPIFHVHGLMVALHTAMLSVCEVIFLEQFCEDAVIASLPAATVMMGVPTHYSRLLRHPGFDEAACRNIRLLVSGSAPMTAGLHAGVAARTGREVLERYGMSEALMITSNPYDGERVPATVGFALPGVEVRVRSENPATMPGVVEVRGPNVGPGYWHRAEATRQSRTSDGWFITSDIGRLDDSGRLRLEGRASDMIISGGENIYPAEIEQAIDSCPSVAESAVVGLEHPDLGEAAVAFVVAEDGSLLEGRDADTSLSPQIAESLRSLSRFKHPKRLVYMEELPRNSMGKVRKSDLRSSHAGMFTKR